MTIRPGIQSVDLEFDCLPLAAGEFVIGAGLAIPNKEWLCRNDSLARLTVLPKDVYGSGLAPTTTRSLLAVSHHWKLEGD